MPSSSASAATGCTGRTRYADTATIAPYYRGAHGSSSTIPGCNRLLPREDEPGSGCPESLRRVLAGGARLKPAAMSGRR